MDKLFESHKWPKLTFQIPQKLVLQQLLPWYHFWQNHQWLSCHYMNISVLTSPSNSTEDFLKFFSSSFSYIMYSNSFLLPCLFVIIILHSLIFFCPHFKCPGLSTLTLQPFSEWFHLLSLDISWKAKKEFIYSQDFTTFYRLMDSTFMISAKWIPAAESMTGTIDSTSPKWNWISVQIWALVLVFSFSINE